MMELRRRDFIMFPPPKQSLGGHIFRGNGEVEIGYNNNIMADNKTYKMILTVNSKTHPTIHKYLNCSYDYVKMQWDKSAVRCRPLLEMNII
jgi:hypothetical protein